MHVPPPPPVYSWHPPPLVSHSPRLALKTRRTRGESTRKSEIAACPARGCEKPHNDTLPYIDVPFYVYTHSATDFVPRYIMHAFCALTPEASISEPGNRGWERVAGESIWRVRRRIVVSLDYFPISNDFGIRGGSKWTRFERDSVDTDLWRVWEFSLSFSRVEKFWRMESKGGNRFRIENFRA